MTDLADKTKQLLDELDEMGLDGEDIPDEIKNLDSDSSEDERTKADHAYRQLREKLRVAKGVIGQQSTELKKKGEKQEPLVPASTPALDPQQQSDFYLSSLQTRAMQKLGIPDAANPLVQMEIQRLYSGDMVTAEKQVTAEKDATVVLEQIYSEFPQLGDDDKEAIREQLSAHDALARTDEALVRNTIYAYMGGNLAKFSKPPVEPKLKPKAGLTKTSSGAAAISDVKARGTGVEPGVGTPGSGATESKPATSEELKEMKKLSVPPEQIEIHRRAKMKKSKYASQ